MKNREQLQQKVETGKIAWSKRLWLAWLALFGTLSFGNITEWIAQESTPQERKDDRKEIVIKTPSQLQNDSTMSSDEVLNMLKGSEDLKSYYKTVIVENFEKWDNFDLLIDHIMWLETVQDLFDVYDGDYIREILEKEINQALKKLKWIYSDELINKSIEEIINNTDFFHQYLDKVIRRCVFDTNFQNAIKNWDNDEIKTIIEKKINDIENGWSFIFAIMILSIGPLAAWVLSVFMKILKKLEEKCRKTNDGELKELL